MGNSFMLSVKLLGSFAVESDAVSPESLIIKSRRARALLAYLSMTSDYKASREELATLLWGDTADVQARHSLRQCLTSLRQDLGGASDFLIIGRNMIGIRSEHLTVDARGFLSYAKSSSPEDLVRAGELYRGNFLADLKLDIEPFDAWRLQESERLRSIAAHIYETLARRCDANNDGSMALDAAERLVALDPVQEEWNRLYLLICARHRGRGTALGRAQAFIDHLKRELDAEPERETLELVDLIKSGRFEPRASATPRQTPSSAPAPATELGSVSPNSEMASISSVARTFEGTLRPLTRNRIKGAVAVAVVLSAAVLCFFAVSTGPALYESRPAEVPLQSGRTDARALAKNGMVPVVVLPFSVDAGGRGSEDQAFAQALTHNLIDCLARYGQLRVVSNETSDTYRGHPVDVTKVGGELGVPYAIVGRVQTDDGSLRVMFQLVDTTSRLTLWSNQLRREPGEMALAAEEITRGIARSLFFQISAADTRRRSGGSDQPSGIADLVNRGWAAERLGPWRENLSEAMRLFDEALRQDPHYKQAMLGVARVTVQAYGNMVEIDPPVDLDRAERLLDELLARAPSLANVHYVWAQLQDIRGRYTASMESFKRAQELNPSLIMAECNIGHLLMWLGNPREGLQHIQHYLRIAPPGEPALGYAYLYAAEAELALGQQQAALGSMLRANAFFPGSPRIQGWVAAVYQIVGDNNNATKFASAFERLAPAAADRILNPMAQAHPPLGEPPPVILDALRVAIIAAHS